MRTHANMVTIEPARSASSGMVITAPWKDEPGTVLDGHRLSRLPVNITLSGALRLGGDVIGLPGHCSNPG
jgi:hypothetical protein